MTAAGFALIAGGLATLVSFRAVLFGTGGRRARRAARVAEVSRPPISPETPRLSPETPPVRLETPEVSLVTPRLSLEPPPVEPPEPESEPEPKPEVEPELPPRRRRSRGSRRRSMVAAPGEDTRWSDDIDTEDLSEDAGAGDRNGGLASIGFAAEEDEPHRPAGDLSIGLAEILAAYDEQEQEERRLKEERYAQVRAANDEPTGELPVVDRYWSAPQARPRRPRQINPPRSRPSPRPRPQTAPEPDNVYVSRHAAEPPH